MSTLTRIITVETLADVADAIKEQVKVYRDRFESYTAGNKKNRGSHTLKTIMEARHIGQGLELAERIARDCVFADDGKGSDKPTTYIGQLRAERRYLDGYAIIDFNSDREIGYALDARRQKLDDMIDAEITKAKKAGTHQPMEGEAT